ncbi:MAG: diguanylate cyclase [Chitinispirillaceae bacterium]|nr:diguanylate cyclase [Chitinispirillaceae bacterium]
MKKIVIRLPIGIKILLGFIPLLVLLFSITSLTLVRLNRVNHINREIVSIDMAADKTAENMGEILLAQESYGRRYMILKSREMLTLFQRRDQEFNREYESAAIAAERYPALDVAARCHDEYNRLFAAVFAVIDSSEKVPSEADSLQRIAFDRQVGLLQAVSLEAKRNQGKKMNAIAEIGRTTFSTVAMLTGVGIALIILITTLISRNILSSIGILKAAANMVSLGTFIHLPKVKSRDELGDLSGAFNEMAERLITLEEAYKDASPLTRLPGGIAIENTVKHRIERGEPFAFCMMDLDNFKPFNDRYGYGRGNTVIKMTAEIIRRAARESGDGTDFVGHIGGDDFALIAKPDRFEEQCRNIIGEFDRRIIEHYDEEDRARGCIVSISRQGEQLTFPIMTISIAAVNSLKSTVRNYIEVGEIVAELKKYAKKFSVSNLVIDRRGGRKRESDVSKKEQLVTE